MAIDKRKRRVRRKKFLGVIYLLKNNKTGDSYIGASANPQQRLETHRMFITNGTHPHRRIRECFRKGGLKCLEMRILEKLDVEHESRRRDGTEYWERWSVSDSGRRYLLRREDHWIEKLSPSLNRPKRERLDIDSLPMGPG